ncbi:MAG: hypothetical protein CSA95_00280 [Bacteroidetes bacterium]|nr:MAG: hypothetical protein CSA95_00280 [Bacteroidota bacterium]PIE88621.1 MAG: hypothetical protein CSA04_00965 [Bacteroidota bacterium]
MITENDKIADLIRRYPFMKERLIRKNKRFSNLNNPLVFKAIGKVARIKDIAAVSGENLEALLQYINEEIEKGEA